MIIRGPYMHDAFATDADPTPNGPIQYGLPYQFQWTPDPETYPDIRLGDKFLIVDPMDANEARRVEVCHRATASGMVWVSCFDPGYSGWIHQMPLLELSTSHRLTPKEAGRYRAKR